jgi:hypothetical protein
MHVPNYACQQKICFMSWRIQHFNTFRKFRHVAYYKSLIKIFLQKNYTNTLLQLSNIFFRITLSCINFNFHFGILIF